jgi:hypothetical protein
MKELYAAVLRILRVFNPVSKSRHRAVLVYVGVVVGLAALPTWAVDEADVDPGSDWQRQFNFDDADEEPATDPSSASDDVRVPDHDARPAVVEHNTVDIAHKTAQYLLEYRLPLRAGAQLLTEQMQGSISAEQGAAAQQSIAAYSAAGLYDRALYLETKLSAGWDTHTLNDFWLQQARLMLSRGEPQPAEQALRRLRQPSSAAASHQRQSLLQLSYINQSRFDAATQAFESAQASAHGAPELIMLTYYNYAISLLGQGRKPEALALLDELGEVTASNNEMLALRDQANLALAWAWLADNQGGSARAVFKRVGLERRSSDMALLGLGWAELAPDGRRQETRFRRKLNCVDELSIAETAEKRLVSSLSPCQPVETAPLFKYYRLFDYEAGAVGAERLRRALIPWQVLVQRDRHEPAVQEAMLAIGYVQGRLKRYADAEPAYRQAIKSYNEEINRLATMEAELNRHAGDPRLVLRRHERPNEFASLRSSNAFASISADLDDLLSAQFEITEIFRNLRRSSGTERKDDAGHVVDIQAQGQEILDGIKSQQAALYESLKRLCLDEIATRRTRLNQYLAHASLALAKLYDQKD